MDCNFAYEFMGFGAVDVILPYEIIGFGAIDGSFAYEFIGFGLWIAVLHMNS